MKLKAVYIDSYGICQKLNIDNFDTGLNLIYGRNGSGKSTLARYIRNVFFGFPTDEVCQGGAIDIENEGRLTRLVRNSQTGNQLQSDMSGSGRYSTVDANTFDRVYFLDGRSTQQSSNSIANLLHHDLHVPLGRVALGDDRQFEEAQRIIAELQTKLSVVSSRIADLEGTRNQLVQKIDIEESDYQRRRSELEHNIRTIDSQLNAINLPAAQSQIEHCDREIAELRLRIDSASDQVHYVSRPYKASDGLTALYRRLDELDNQLRRWRAVHVDVQSQRVTLKDEMSIWNDMTMESESHPYHRSRAILTQLESKISSAERTVQELRNHGTAQNSFSVADQMADLCEKIRSDLYSLCDELGNQYKTVRHRSAAAELKRLRRCYHEIGENIDALVENRRLVIEEIRHLDPAGATAIGRAENGFCQCAQHEGYLQARRKFIGELEQQSHSVELIRNDLTDEKMKLNDLEQRRAAMVRDLVRMENELSDLTAQRKAILLELDRTNSVVDMTAIRSKLEKTQMDLNSLIAERRSIQLELERNQTVQPQPANTILESAARYIKKLTASEIRNVWIENRSVDLHLRVENRFEESYDFDRLSSGLQQQVVLGVCLATVEYCTSLGKQHTMILDDVFVNLDSELIESTFSTLVEFTNLGHQIVALTSDPLVMEIAAARNTRRFDLPVLDLPDPIVPTVPLWNPERSTLPPTREPETYRPRYAEPLTNEIEIKSYRPYATPTNLSTFDASLDTKPSVRPELDEIAAISESSELSQLRIDRNNLEFLNLAGIFEVRQLLEIEPAQMKVLYPGQPFSDNDLDQWQSLAWMLLCVPALEMDDAELLLAMGINEPEQLENTHGQQLVDRINRFLSSSESRSRNYRSGYNRDRINRWYDSLGRTRSKWRMPSGYSRRNRWRSSASRPRTERTRRERLGFTSEREPRERSRRTGRNEHDSARSTRRFDRNRTRENQTVSISKPESKTESSKTPMPVPQADLKFYLEQSDALEAAPSIGPKTAERFIKIGVETVGDFLVQTAESMAPKINYKRISVDVIRQWQQQARLVCRIPNLRGHDAQLLVACGITEPEDVAGMNPDKAVFNHRTICKKQRGFENH